MVATQSVTQRQFHLREWMMWLFLLALCGLIGLLIAAIMRYSLPIEHRLALGAAADFPVSDRPYTYPARQFVADLWIVHQADGWYALDPTVQHPFVRCKVRWVEWNSRFEDPCLGVKFALNGGYLEGPTGTHLLRYPIKVDKDGMVVVDLERPLVETEAEYIERCMSGVRSQQAPLYNFYWGSATSLDSHCAKLWEAQKEWG